MGIDPVTLAVISAVSSGVQGFMGMQQSNAMAKASRRNAEANIQNEQNRLAVEKKQLSRRQDQLRGEQRVKAAGSGAGVSSFDWLMEDAGNQMLLDAALLEYDSKVQQESIRYGGAVQSAEYKAQGRSALLSGISKGFSTYQDGLDKAKTADALNVARNSNRNAGL